MTVWKIYIKKKYVDDGIKSLNQFNAPKGSELYAFTNKKKYVEGFKAARDMKKFFIRKCKMDEDDFVEYANSDIRGKVLIKTYLQTRDPENPMKVINAKIIMTDIEYQTVEELELGDSIVGDSMWWRHIGCIGIFNNKILKAFKTLGILYFYDIMTERSSYKECGIRAEDSWEWLDYSIDRLTVFLSLFGSTVSDK